LKKLVFTDFLFDVQYKKDSAKDKSAASSLVSLDKAFNWITTTFEWLDC